MNTKIMIKTAGLDILKGAVVAFASLVGMIVSSMLTRMLGLPAVVMPAYMSLSKIMPLMLLTWVLMAILLGECFQRLYRRYWQRFLAIWLCNYLLYYAINTLDSLLFMPVPNMTTSFFGNLINALLPALVIAWLWKPKASITPEINLTGYFSARKSADWAWRFIAAWLIYPPTYYLMGRVVAIFTLHYYQDPSLNWGLTLPPLGTLMAMQVLRGALFLLAVLPIILPWKDTRTGLLLWLGALIFFQIAAQTMIQAYWFPLDLRIPHTLELLADSFIQASLYALLLYVPAFRVAQPAVQTRSPMPAKINIEGSL